MDRHLEVGGVGYIGRAGAGLPRFEQPHHAGSDRDRVYYRVKHGFGGVLMEGVMGKDIREGYLDEGSRRELEQLGNVKYKSRHDVESAGMSDYILWGAG